MRGNQRSLLQSSHLRPFFLLIVTDGFSFVECIVSSLGPADTSVWVKSSNCLLLPTRLQLCSAAEPELYHSAANCGDSNGQNIQQEVWSVYLWQTNTNTNTNISKTREAQILAWILFSKLRGQLPGKIFNKKCDWSAEEQAAVLSPGREDFSDIRDKGDNSFCNKMEHMEHTWQDNK